jgi:hypothetical protein
VPLFGTRDAVRLTAMMLFTVDLANRMLPLVSRIVEDIVSGNRRWQETIAELDVVSAQPRSELPDPRLTALEKRARQQVQEIEAFEAELEKLGIQLKDRRAGLIDFPSELDGRRVLLCWRLGEPSVQFWHDEDAGFAGRRPLSPTLVG